MKHIELLHGQIATVSDEDYDYLLDFNWYLSGNYAYRFKEIMLPMHLEVVTRMGLKVNLGMLIDHEDRNTLNNQRNNLRILTPSQNNYNSKIPKDNTSGFKGVSFNIRKRKWAAYIVVRRKQIHLGYFNELENAVAARLKAEQHYIKLREPNHA